MIVQALTKIASIDALSLFSTGFVARVHDELQVPREIHLRHSSGETSDCKILELLRSVVAPRFLLNPSIYAKFDDDLMAY